MQPRVDVLPDEDRPEGGHAIILIRDVTIMPAAPRFEITAIPDDPDDPNSEPDWLLAEQQPLSAEITPDGLAIRVGPAVVDAVELQPGTPVVFSMPASDIRAELSWPDLPITIPVKLPAPVVGAAELRAEKIKESRRAAEAAAAKAEAERAEAAARPVPSVENLASVAAAAASERTSQAVGKTTDRARTSGTSPRRTAPKRPRVSASGKSAPRPAAPTSDATLNLAADTQRARQPGKISERTAGLTTPAPGPATVPSLQQISAKSTDDDGVAGRRWLSIVLAILAIPAILLALWPSLQTETVEPAARSALSRLASSDWVSQILNVGERSPSGIDASDMTANEALRRAQEAIFNSGGKPNIAERRFWLRKSIEKLLSDPQSRWAATQLGALQTSAANPRKRPDYRAAHTLWDLASASGDNVATCFLAQLYELGLGVDADGDRAAQLQQRADTQGGCDLKHERPTPALTN